MTPEGWKCAVRKAPQRRPLLDNGSLGMFAQQWMGRRIIEELLEMVISIKGGHVIDSAVIQSEENSEGSSVDELS
jgi:hypothetical protein